MNRLSETGLWGQQNKHEELHSEVRLGQNKSTINGFVRAVKFSPALLKNHDPYFLSFGRVGSHEAFVVSANWKIVINNNLFEDSLVEDSSHINPILIDSETGKDAFNSGVLFCQPSDGTEEVTVSDAALKYI